MRSKSYSVLVIGLLALGFLVVGHATPWGPTEAQAQGEPLILFLAPAGVPRYLDTADPIDPAIEIDVEVSFPDASTPCSGAPLPVDPNTLTVKVHRQLDADRLQTWDDIDEGTWVWDAEFKNVTGTVTIGGPLSDQDRSFYGIEVCISNASAQACATKGIRVEYPVSGFQGGSFNTYATNFSQSPGCGLIDPGLIPIINNMMKETLFGVIAPDAAGIGSGPPGNTVQFLAIPLLGNINMAASLNAGTNDVDLAPVSVSGIDLGVIDGLPPGYNCAISGSADGSLMGEVSLSPYLDLDGSIRVFGMTLSQGSGIGECTRNATGCELNISFDGDPPY